MSKKYKLAVELRGYAVVEVEAESSLDAVGMFERGIFTAPEMEAGKFPGPNITIDALSFGPVMDVRECDEDEG